MDEDTRAKKISDLKKSKRFGSMNVDEFDKEIIKYGIFALISMRELTPQQALEEYYDRICIEYFFNVFKNAINADPVRLHSQQTIDGHIYYVLSLPFFILL